MSVHLYISPAASGKTTYALNLVRETARQLQSILRVIVPTHIQARSWRRRLAEAGGAIGIRVMTFDRLYAECLSAANEAYTELSEPVQYRLIRAILDNLPLTHYAALVDRPGFVHILQDLISELKAARVWPEEFAHAIKALGNEPRLRELAQVYMAYQQRLQTAGWADRAGLGWLAVESLEQRAPDVARDWPLLVLDGFDSFTPVQLAMTKSLANRVGELIITLTGEATTRETRPVHRRFVKTRQQLEKALGAKATPLPTQDLASSSVMAHLEANLFRGQVARVPAGNAVDLVEAPDRAAEARAALRWLKTCVVNHAMRPHQVALLARSISTYRPFILQIADEFGLPIRLVEGLPLRSNLAISAILDVLRLMLPADTDDQQPALPRRLVIEAWRSPYFDWSALSADEAQEPIGIVQGDADSLDVAARWGQVIGGLTQWEEALAALTTSLSEVEADEETRRPANVPVATAAQALADKFHRFVQRLTPPPDARSYRDFVSWLETLIGSDPVLQSSRFPAPAESTSLCVVEQVRAAVGPIAELDVAALQVLKDVLRGLVWAEEAVGTSNSLDLATFFADMASAIEAAVYYPPVHPDHEEILVADVIQVRGVPFRAVAVLGLAEGEFPATLGEDPFLRDADRRELREDFGIDLQPSTESAEIEFFYETVTRPYEQLLLTRPRLADNGAPWQASPFWEEIRRLVDVQPVRLTSESIPQPDQVASWVELTESLATHSGFASVRRWVKRVNPDRQTAVGSAAQLFQTRQSAATGSAFDGDLSSMADELGKCYGPNHTWSASRLENYRACPFMFFMGNVLGLEPRDEPSEGLSVRQLGTIYHRIFEQVYQSPQVADPTDLSQLLAALPEVAQRILDEAPDQEGFRVTAWWNQTRQEMEANVRMSLSALAALQSDFVPIAHECRFMDAQQLVVKDGRDRFKLRGIIDRVDRAPDGSIRIIDYKTSGPSSYGKSAFIEGKKLQLPLYALAARDALRLGDPVDGFYWHIQHGKPSGFRLNSLDGGPEAAIDVAVEKAWEAVRGARHGDFVPHPPDPGCPSYCPAMAFCWHYRPGFGG